MHTRGHQNIYKHTSEFTHIYRFWWMAAGRGQAGKQEDKRVDAVNGKLFD